MAKIAPFKGILYNPNKVGDLNKIMAPPYDVISPAFQDELYKRHPHNIIRLILGKTFPDDAASNDRYSRAAADFKKWRDEDILVIDKTPAIYYYIQVYKVGTDLKSVPSGQPLTNIELVNGQRRARKGFIALARLEEFGKGGIHPHEKTLAGPKADRLKLMEACNANFSCIFSLYSEPHKTINRLLEDCCINGSPIIDVADDDGVESKVWRIDRPETIKKVVEAMSDKPLFIADGHHRYETALNYRNMMREQLKDYTGNELFNYVMMYFSNMDDEGMTIMPTHRIIHSITDFKPNTFLANCSSFFDIEEFKWNGKVEPRVRKEFYKSMEDTGARLPSFGLYINGIDSYFALALKQKDTMDEVFGSSIHDVFKSLDVTVLHALILNNILGISSAAQENQTNLVYIKSMDDAIEETKKHGRQMAFLLNPTKIEQVKAVASSGQVMPQKSTYFYPKLLSGMVINPIGNGEVVCETVSSNE
ncbi:MAG: DUF1015 domain-containing protein [Deltaproteobacteria bacterium]|nr:DUF1015 domain-containing protein [Deltaproteobacteria bacterium]